MKIVDLSLTSLISRGEIPLHSYNVFWSTVETCMKEEDTYPLAYFGLRADSHTECFCIMALSAVGTVGVLRHRVDHSNPSTLPALSAEFPAFERFERELAEDFDLNFAGHPWPKPIRYSVERRAESEVETYPFFQIDSEEIHEVGVGPIHAGIIEPGHFRFQCHGERILHLEVQLGYQHRGIEQALIRTRNPLRQTILAESISGDSVIGHTAAFASVMESLSSINASEDTDWTRTLGLELERMAMHIGDLSAMCADVGFQFGAAVLGGLRTPIINAEQELCGSRTGRSFIRIGTNPTRLKRTQIRRLTDILSDVEHRLREACRSIFNERSLLHRFENTGFISKQDALRLGTVGMVARSCGITRDARLSHPSFYYRVLPYTPVTTDSGDVLARAKLRRLELEASFAYVKKMLSQDPRVPETNLDNSMDTAYLLEYPCIAPDSLAVSLVEGWRGVICHVAVTGTDGQFERYKIVDPSFHNWHAETVAIRHNEISDFPICNKSFNLSYCGHDL